MLPEKLPALTTAAVLNLIENAQNAEVCRDLRALREILQSLWDFNDRLPDFKDYPPPMRAELLRLCGFYCSTYGLSRRLANYQERGKDLLTTAIDVFRSCGLPDKAAEAKVILAFCYWNAGEVGECEAILETVEKEFGDNSLHPVWLQIRINRLMVHYWREEFDEGIKLIEKISQPMEYCADLRLKTMFHNQAGMIYRRRSLTDESITHYREAIRFARQTGNLRFVAATYNNLSLLQRDNGYFEIAHSSAREAIKILESIGDGWFLPHVFDTAASIYLAEEKPTRALEAIEKAVELFERSEDARGLAEALWTRVRCLLRTSQTEDALLAFGRLQQVAETRIGEGASRKFARALTEEIYVLRGAPLLDEVSEFKRSQIAHALVQAGGAITEAARLLKLKNHKTLSQMLGKQFPDLRAALGFERRKLRSDAALRPKNAQEKRTVVLQRKDIFEEREITRIVLTDKNYSFDFRFSSDRFETFYFQANQMKKFGVEGDSVIAVFPLDAPAIGKTIVAVSGGSLLVGTIEYDDKCGFFFIRDETGFPVPVDEKSILGEPLGYCPAQKIDEKFINFSKLTS